MAPPTFSLPCLKKKYRFLVCPIKYLYILMKYNVVISLWRAQHKLYFSGFKTVEKFEGRWWWLILLSFTGLVFIIKQSAHMCLNKLISFFHSGKWVCKGKKNCRTDEIILYISRPKKYVRNCWPVTLLSLEY